MASYNGAGPLANKIRPKSLNAFVGQRHLVENTLKIRSEALAKPDEKYDSDDYLPEELKEKNIYEPPLEINLQV